MLNLLTQFGAGSCTLPTTKFGIPTWYKYLPGEIDPINGKCQLQINFDVDKLISFTSIGLAILEIMLFVAGAITIAYVMYGAFQYLISQGDPERTKVAKNAILNALIGLVIAIIATTVVRFIATRLS